MTYMTGALPADDLELEDLEPEPADAENVKGGASEGSDPDNGGKGGKG